MLKKFKRRIILYGLGILVLCVAMPFILDIVLYNLSLYNSHLTISEWSSFNGSYIGAVIGGIATLLGVFITLQYTELKNKESELKENSLIVYYDLYFGLSDLKKIYINYKNSNFKNIPSKMFFSKEWIKNVAKLSEEIDQIDKIYLLYGDLEMLASMIEMRKSLSLLNTFDDYNDNDENKMIEKLAEKVFTTEFIESDMEQYTNDAELKIGDLNETYANIILSLMGKMK